MKLLQLAVLAFLSILSILCAVETKCAKSHGRNNRQFDMNNDTLIAAHVIFRHGARNIEYNFPNNPYKDEKYWPGGISQLTNEGKQQQYKLGQYLRRRYDGLFGADKKYSANKIYIQSTDVDRTLMSAQANLAGLFFPTDEEIWNEEIWQPVPVHTIPKPVDHVLYTIVDCPKYTALREKYLNESKEVQRIFSEHANIFSYLTQKSGMNVETMYDVYKILDTFHIESQHNMSLPKWAKDVIKPDGVVEYISTYDFKTYPDTPEMARLICGSLFKEILQHFSEKIDHTLKHNRSLWLYSGHDFTIANILNGLGLYELHIPPFASSIHFELFKTDDNDHYVQIFYKKSEEENLSPMNIPKCGVKCSLKQLYEIYSEIIPDDFHAECRLN